jgi:amidase
MLDVIAGYDPADPITAFGWNRKPRSYADSLTAKGLAGARVGVLTDMFGREAVHQEVNAVVERAIATMSALGATIVRISIPGLDDLTRDLPLIDFEFRSAFDRYLARLGPRAPVRTLEEFVARGEYHASLKAGLEADLRRVDPMRSAEYQTRLLRRDVLRQALSTALASHRLDAILYPHQRRLVALIGEEQLERNGVLSNSTGFPALTFPGGFTAATSSAPDGIPVGIEILGPDWSEPTLFRLAYAFQESARPRRPPASTPPLR